MRKIAVPAMIISLLMVSSAHSQSEDPKAQARRDAKRIDDQYQSATKRSSWATTPKPLGDPWQTVKSPPAADKK